jgi:hypothetical protein
MQQATGLGNPFSEIFLQLFCKKYLEKRNILSKFRVVLKKKSSSKRTYKFFCPKIATTAYNMKGCLMF